MEKLIDNEWLPCLTSENVQSDEASEMIYVTPSVTEKCTRAREVLLPVTELVSSCTRTRTQAFGQAQAPLDLPPR